MELSRKPCIISVGVNGAYEFGVDRLERSLLHHGWAGRTMFWRDYPPGCPQHTGDGQYNFKPHAFVEAFEQGHKVVLWLDASCYVIKDPMPIFDYISDNGLFFFRTGYPLSATTTDKLLDFAGEKREDLIEVPEMATGAIGVNIENPNGMKFMQEWIRYMQAGMFGGSRTHNRKDSEHPLFLFSRQDQANASLILHKMDILETGQNKGWICYYPHIIDSTIVIVKGL